MGTISVSAVDDLVEGRRCMGAARCLSTGRVFSVFTHQIYMGISGEDGALVACISVRAVDVIIIGTDSGTAKRQDLAWHCMA